MRGCPLTFYISNIFYKAYNIMYFLVDLFFCIKYIFLSKNSDKVIFLFAHLGMDIRTLQYRAMQSTAMQCKAKQSTSE